MKRMFIILAAILTATTFASAQNDLSKVNTLKIGVMGGVSVPMNNAGGNLGLDVGYQYLVTPNFGLGLATGYNHFIGKQNKVGAVEINNNSFGVVPVAALLRYYPKSEGFYFGSDLGYGFIVGDDKVASNHPQIRSNGGFYIKPEIGYHNRDWNVYIHYTKVFTGNAGNINLVTDSQKYNVGSIGIGVAYNIGLGK